MPDQIYTAYKLDLATIGAGQDWRCALLMSLTDAGTINDDVVSVLTDFVNLDEFDGANYPPGRALITTTASRDDAFNRAEINAPSFVFPSLGNGTRLIEGALIFKNVGADSVNIPIRYVERAENLAPGGEDVTVAPDADGIYTIT